MHSATLFPLRRARCRPLKARAARESAWVIALVSDSRPSLRFSNNNSSSSRLQQVVVLSLVQALVVIRA